MTLELAIQDDAALVKDRSPMSQGDAFEKARTLGARHIRANIFSSDLKALGWGPYDRFINQAVLRGFQVQLTITGQPRWSADKHEHSGDVPYHEPTPYQFANFARYVVEHTQDRVRRFSLWNEPNHPAFLSAASPAQLYGQLYRTAYRAVRSVDNDCAILFGELSGRRGAPAFLQAATAYHTTHASGMAVHPYQYITHPLRPVYDDSYEWGHLPALKDHLKTFRDRGWLTTRAGLALPIYSTEFGYHRRPGDKRTISESRRRDYTKRTIQDAHAWGLQQYLWYHLVNAPPGADWDTGIVGWDGKTSSTYRAIQSSF